MAIKSKVATVGRPGNSVRVPIVVATDGLARLASDEHSMRSRERNIPTVRRPAKR